MTEVDKSVGDFPIKINEFVFILSLETGKIKTVVGPAKVQIASSEELVVFNKATKTFDRIGKPVAQMKVITPKGWYTILTNPTTEGQEQPRPGQTDDIQADRLLVGTRIVINGPSNMALWPGQFYQTVKGHTLKSNEYLVCKVYDPEPAMKITESELVTGQRIIVKGTDVSFYVPPTGIEVLANDNGEFIRDAVTLQKMEYCVLVKENGEERFEFGPQVIFPAHDEKFRYKDQSNKFRAIDLSELSGVYVKVTEKYTEGDEKFTEGQELFITGKTTPIYVPRKEHSIISYGGKSVTHAVAIPAGEGRYLMDRTTGNISIKKGPSMHLADPRTEVYARRILTDSQCNLWFPGNTEALMHNKLISNKEVAKVITDSGLRGFMENSLINTSASYASNSFAGDKIQRGHKFTKPRTVEIDTKYEGAIKMDVWPGYALLLKNSKDETRSIIGPRSVLLEYDEVPIAIEVSTGQPKGTGGSKRRDIYLNLSANHVTDIVEVETNDFVKIKIKLSYRINFIGEDHAKWWAVKNYVKLLCDNMRSRLKQKAKLYGVEYFYSTIIDLCRTTVLGEDGSYTFEENNMKVYDVEILETVIEDRMIRESLANIQANAMQVVLAKKAMMLKYESDEATLEYSDKLSKMKHDSNMESMEREELRNVEQRKMHYDTRLEAKKLELDIAVRNGEISSTEIANESMVFDAHHSNTSRAQDLEVKLIQAKSDANVKQLSIISDKLGAAIIHASNNKALGELAGAFGDVAVFEKDGLIETSKNLLGPIAEQLIDTITED